MTITKSKLGNTMPDRVAIKMRRMVQENAMAIWSIVEDGTVAILIIDPSPTWTETLRTNLSWNGIAPVMPMSADLRAHLIRGLRKRDSDKLGPWLRNDVPGRVFVIAERWTAHIRVAGVSS